MLMKLIVFEKSVGAVIFRTREDGEKEFLLVRYRSGHWEFPRGHVEKDETEEETLRREIKEETGISDLKIISNFRERIWLFYRAGGQEKEKRLQARRGLNIIKAVILYLVETQDKDTQINFENTDYVWLPMEKALKKITFDKAKKVFKKAQNFLA